MSSRGILLREQTLELALRAMEKAIKIGNAELVMVLESTVILLNNVILAKAQVYSRILQNLVSNAMAQDSLILIHVKSATVLGFLSQKQLLSVKNVMVPVNSGQQELLNVRNVMVQVNTTQNVKNAAVLATTNLDKVQ